VSAVGFEPLSLQQVDALFAANIRPNLTGTRRRADPVLVLIGGQQGAGKTTARRRVLRQFGLSHARSLEPDELIYEHPHQDELARADDRTVGMILGGVVNHWATSAIDHIISTRVDAVITAPLDSPDYVATLIRRFQEDGGYRVLAVFLGVDEAHSSLGIVDRYHAQRQQTGHGAWIPLAIHDRAYSAVLSAADVAERLADASYVCRRDGRLIHRAERAALQPGSLREAIRRTRQRMWSDRDFASFVRRTTALSQEIREGRLAADLTPTLAQAIMRGVGPQARYVLQLRSAAAKLSTGEPDGRVAAGMGLNTRAAIREQGAHSLLEVAAELEHLPHESAGSPSRAATVPRNDRSAAQVSAQEFPLSVGDAMRKAPAFRRDPASARRSGVDRRPRRRPKA
jgi:predicted ABC-type ATPase